MTWWEALIFGVVQGLTEFFPVSSSGHLVMTEQLLGLTIPGVSFEVALHVATLVSVLIVYRQRIATLALGAVGRGSGDTAAWPYLLKLALATVPAAVAGIGFGDWFAARFDDGIFAGTMILVTGSVVWSSRWALAKRSSPRSGEAAVDANRVHDREGLAEGSSPQRGEAGRRVRPGATMIRSPLDVLPIAIAAAVSAIAGTAVPFVAVLSIEAMLFAIARATSREWVAEPGWGAALLMGIGQAVAILPGISRSGSTVLTGLWRRIDPVAAAEFSFLMSIPAVLGAALLELPELRDGSNSVGAPALAIGAVAAGTSGVLAIRFFVRMLQRQSFHAFAWYCWLAGALFVLTRR